MEPIMILVMYLAQVEEVLQFLIHLVHQTTKQKELQVYQIQLAIFSITNMLRMKWVTNMVHLIHGMVMLVVVHLDKDHRQMLMSQVVVVL